MTKSETEKAVDDMPKVRVAVPSFPQAGHVKHNYSGGSTLVDGRYGTRR
jgi:hypothetical protein